MALPFLWVSGIKEAYKGLLNGNILEGVKNTSVGTLAQGLHPAPRSRILQVPLLRQNLPLWRLFRQQAPLIVAVNRKWRGNSIDVMGKRLRDVLPLLKRKVLDVEVEVKFKRRKYRGKQSIVNRRFRLVLFSIWNLGNIIPIGQHRGWYLIRRGQLHSCALRDGKLNWYA